MILVCLFFLLFGVLGHLLVLGREESFDALLQIWEVLGLFVGCVVLFLVPGREESFDTLLWV